MSEVAALRFVNLYYNATLLGNWFFLFFHFSICFFAIDCMVRRYAQIVVRGWGFKLPDTSDFIFY